MRQTCTKNVVGCFFSVEFCTNWVVFLLFLCAPICAQKQKIPIHWLQTALIPSQMFARRGVHPGGDGPHRTQTEGSIENGILVEKEQCLISGPWRSLPFIISLPSCFLVASFRLLCFSPLDSTSLALRTLASVVGGCVSSAGVETLLEKKKNT